MVPVSELVKGNVYGNLLLSLSMNHLHLEVVLQS